MFLPDYVRACIDTLEAAGFAAYAVGGCVRDACLGLTPHDYDLCTSATPEQMKQVFSGFQLVLAGEKHGTVSIVTEGGLVEITTFRTEGEYLDNRHPQWVEFVEDVSGDLARRDFTVNAMAYSPLRGFADPFGGREDLKNKVLRAVGDPFCRFREDSLRILRGVRFSVRYSLDVEEETMKAMTALTSLMDNLARERVFDELCKLLPLVSAEDLRRFAPVFAAVIPELAPMVDFDQHSPHHAYDLYTHTAHVTGAVGPNLTLRWAALLHDTGKIPTFTRDETGRGHFYGHATHSAEMANSILLRLKAPTALRERCVTLIGLHMTALDPDKKLLRRRIGQLGLDTLRDLIDLQEADMGSKGTGKPEEMLQFRLIRSALQEVLEEDACLSVKDLAINGSDLLREGFVPGKALGQCLQSLLELVQDELIKNERDALLEAARLQLRASQ